MDNAIKEALALLKAQGFKVSKGEAKAPKGKAKAKAKKNVILKAFDGGEFKPIKTLKGLELSLQSHIGCVVKNNKDIQKVDVKNIPTLINLINKGQVVTLITSSKKNVYIFHKRNITH